VSIKVLDYGGKTATGTFAVPEHKTLAPETVATVLRAVTSNADRQQPQTLTRTNVRGGGRKPWRQKGTGRARAGSSSSPLWRGGGVTFGPIGQMRAYRNINRSVRQAALATLLAARASDDRLVVLKGPASLAKTKQAAGLFGALGWTGRTLFVATSAELPHLVGARNLATAECSSAEDFNLADLGRSTGAVFTEAAFAQVTARAPAKTPGKAGSLPATQPEPAAKPPAKTSPKPAARPTTPPAATTRTKPAPPKKS